MPLTKEIRMKAGASNSGHHFRGASARVLGWTRFTVLGAGLAAGVCPAGAQEREDSLVVSRPVVVFGNRVDFEPQAYIELRRSDEPGAVAEVLFMNRRVNSASDNGTYRLELGDVMVDVTFTWNPEGKDEDRINVSPGSAHWISEPSLDVREETSVVMLVYPPIS